TASGGAVNVSATLAGNGDGAATGVVGNVSATGGTLRAGTVAGDVGKLTMSSLFLHNGAITADLGSGTSADLLNVLGNVTFGDNGSSSLTLNVAGATPVVGNAYEIIDYTGTRTQNANFTIAGPLGFIFALDYSTANKVFLDVISQKPVLVWSGAEDLTTW